ncbi:amidase family protein [Patiriisocius sp. Uisw_047]|jgi:amidase|uniref:amidase family protein n=1 Tax=Patiriisocius sp. Uisw_047 TaxID=3230969 RepID=UPI0039EC5458
MRALLLTLSIVSIISCKAQTEKPKEDHNDSHHNNGGWVITENEMLHQNRSHESGRMQFKLVNSKYQNEEYVFDDVLKDIARLSDARYAALKPLILEQDIARLQEHVSSGKMSYEELTLFYLKRMFIYETNPSTSLHSIISINPNVVAQAREKDQTKHLKRNEIFGMPILLKDNIDTKEMKTTAGAFVLKDNQPAENATIVNNIIANGGLIIGKANLSEWAYYFCNGCPLGYSAIGGQTLNPFGRGQFETGGSSAGSGVAASVNYAVAAVGSETSGSIISPSSQNSVVGLKPTTGALSGDGIVPISHTLDTAGPMAKSVADAEILFWAMKYGQGGEAIGRHSEPKSALPKDIRLGVFKNLLDDAEYSAAIDKLKAEGVQVIEINPSQLPLPGFLTLLNIEMRDDLPKYLANRASQNISEKSLLGVMTTNRIDSVQRMPYGQGIFDAIMADNTTEEDFINLRETLLKNGNAYFEAPMKKHKLDAIATINNYHSSYAAVGLRPCLAIPMGLQDNGEPKAFTLITDSNTEQRLLQLGKTIESILKGRVAPLNFR